MQYKKQRKTSLWLILLFIPLLVGCNPVTLALSKFFVYLGEELTAMAVGQTIEVIFDKLIPYLSDHVIIDADDPLKGTYAGNLRFEMENANCQYRYTRKNPRMFRTSIDEIWKPISSETKEINKIFDEHC